VSWPRQPVSHRTRASAPDDEPAYPREPGHLVLAGILLAQDRPGQALALLDRLHAAAVARDRDGSLIEIGALRALALAVAGDGAGAVSALARRCIRHRVRPAHGSAALDATRE